MRKPKKPSQAVQFDLNEVPREPRSPLVMLLNFLAISGGFLIIALLTAHLVGLIKVESSLVTGLINAAIMFGAMGKALGYLGHMREIAEWRAERELIYPKDSKPQHNQR